MPIPTLQPTLLITVMLVRMLLPRVTPVLQAGLIRALRRRQVFPAAMTRRQFRQ